MKEVWELCKKLNNPVRMKVLVEIYKRRHDPGMNVGILVDTCRINEPTASEHLSALSSLGLIQRRRSGRFVNYYPEIKSDNPNIDEIGQLIRERVLENPTDLSFTKIFPAMMNAFRARAVTFIAKSSGVTLLDLAERYDKELRLITRDLRPAVKLGLLSVSAEGADGLYTYNPPSDPIARRIIELSS